MRYPEDKKAIESLRRWELSEIDNALLSIDFDIAHAVEMTPIEQIVFFALSRFSKDKKWEIFPQYRIGRYRVDFLVKIGDLSKIIIECDGHNFHEKTKEQAQNDKRRDRELQSLGFKVFRFTGSEIWNSIGDCVLISLGIKEENLVLISE